MIQMIVILWFIMSFLVSLEYLPFCKNLSKRDLIIVTLIFLIGGPAFALTTILSAVLDTIFPEGWND